VALPTADATGAANMSGTDGKVALVNTTIGLACNGFSTLCSPTQLAQIVDLVGWGVANFFEGAAAPATNNTISVARQSNGCTETDNNATDFTVGAPSPSNTASPLTPCVDTAPTVSSTNPANGALTVAENTDLLVNFSEAVNVASGWFTLVCSTSGAHTASFSGGPTSFILNPDVDFGPGEQCTLTIVAANVTDQDSDDPPDALAADFTLTFETNNACVQPFTSIPAIQGRGPTAAITGAVTTKGVVVGDYEGAAPALRGFYLQDPSGDGNPATADGIFVFNGSNNSVNLGDLVYVSGTASEFQDQTQISATSIVKCGAGAVTPVDVTFPVPSNTYLEQYEGMLVRLPQTLFVTEHFQLGRFGQVVMSAESRLKQPTSVVALVRKRYTLVKGVLHQSISWHMSNSGMIYFAVDGTYDGIPHSLSQAP
jgi:uncharacterized protein